MLGFGVAMAMESGLMTVCAIIFDRAFLRLSLTFSS